jgi:O-antigen ligase
MDFSSPLEDPFERWTYRLLLCAVFSVCFSIASGQVFLALTILSFALLYMRGGKLVFPRVSYIVVAFMLLAFLTAWFGPNPDLAMRKSMKLFWLLALPIAASCITDSNRLRNLVGAFALGSSVQAAVILIMNPINARAAMSAGEPGTQGADGAPDFLTSLIHMGSMTDGQVLMLGLISTFGLYFVARHEKARGLGWILLLLVQGIAFVINFKRGSWICLVLVIGLVILLSRKWKILFALAIILGGLLAVPAVQVRLGDLTTELSEGKGGRMYMWKVVLPAMQADYPYGVGFGAMTPELLKEHGELVEPNRNHLHSNFAQSLAEMGYVGLGLFCVLMLWGLYCGLALYWRSRSSSFEVTACAAVMLLMLMGLLLNGVIEYNFGDTELLILYGVILGVLCSPVQMSHSGFRGTSVSLQFM